MFEIVGLLLGFAVCMVLSVAASAIVGGLVWLLSRRARLLLTSCAAVLPPLCVIYLFACGAMLPNESLFGDISQPLPNVYFIRALGKMPDFAEIGRGSDFSSGSVSLTECIGSLAVYRPLVVGRYSHPGDSFDAHPNEAYFLFDTRTAAHQDFATAAALEASVGHAVTLTDVQFFHSQEPTYLHQRRINAMICFVPMTLAFSLLALLVVASRYSGAKSQ